MYILKGEKFLILLCKPILSLLIVLVPLKTLKSIVCNLIFFGKKELIDYIHNQSLKFEVDGSAIRRQSKVTWSDVIRGNMEECKVSKE